MKRNIIVINILVGLICTQCSLFDSSDQPQNLKQTLEANVTRINNALGEISATQAFNLITLSDATLKSDAGYNDSITLDLISGIYAYQPDTTFRCHHDNSFRLFKKTGESDSLIVKLPGKFVFHPAHLHEYSKCEEVLKNNFTIAASDYHYYYNFWSSYDYKLNAAFALDSVDIGTLSILALGESFNKQACSSEYTFPEGYKIASGFESGDTSTYEFALWDETDLLLGESVVFIKGDANHDDDDTQGEECDNEEHEWQYTLSIGNIDIKRSTEIDSIQVFLDGVLQKKAAVVIVDNDETDTHHSVCHHRDILLTFDDGTTAKLSELISPALEQLRTLVDSLRSMYFAQRIVDYIAFNIYYSRE